MCNKDYIGCYKDQKAYLYWDSGLLALFTYIKHVLKNHVLLYSSVKASQAMTDVKKYGLLPIKRVKPKITFYVLGVRVWQVPMKHAIISLLVFIRLTTQIRKDSVIHHALNKLVLTIKIQRKKLYLKE